MTHPLDILVDLRRVAGKFYLEDSNRRGHSNCTDAQSCWILFVLYLQYQEMTKTKTKGCRNLKRVHRYHFFNTVFPIDRWQTGYQSSFQDLLLASSGRLQDLQTPTFFICISRQDSDIPEIPESSPSLKFQASFLGIKIEGRPPEAMGWPMLLWTRLQ